MMIHKIKIALMSAFVTVALVGGGVWIFRQPVSESLIQHAWTVSQRTDAYVRPFPWVRSFPVAELEFPETGRRLVVMSGVSSAVLEYAPLWHEGTPRPGEAGISLISGDYRNQFSFLKRMRPGDSFEVNTANGKKHYIIEELKIVDGAPVRIPGADRDSVIILSTSYPYKNVSNLPGDADSAMQLIAVAREQSVQFADLQ